MLTPARIQALAGLLLTMLFALACGQSNGDGRLDNPPAGKPIADLPADTTAAPVLAQGLLSLQLPSPAELERTASTAPEDYMRYIYGFHPYSLLPMHNLDKTYEYFPQWQDQSSGLANAAYAGYGFYGFEDYTGEMRLRLSWDSPLPAGDCYVALANFDSNRWVWFEDTAAGNVTASTAPYISDNGNVYAMVLLLGQQSHYLDYLLLGTDTAPEVYLSTSLNYNNPLANIGPLTLDIDVTNSSVVGGSITGFDYDFDGDGNYDLLDEQTGIVQHLYQPGTYSLTVRANGSDGQSGIAVDDFVIIDPNNQPPLAQLGFLAQIATDPWTMAFVVGASSDPDGSIIKYEFDLDDDGTFDISTTDNAPANLSFGRYGPNTLTLRVTDNNLATDLDSYSFNVDTGFEISVLDQGVDLSSQPRMCVLGTEPNLHAAVVYNNSASKEVFYTHALQNPPQQWSVPVAPAPLEARFDYNPALGIGGNASLAIWQGKPVICYFDWNGSNLAICRAVDSDGSGWEEPFIVDSAGDSGEFSAMLVIDDTPIICYSVESSKALRCAVWHP